MNINKEPFDFRAGLLETALKAVPFGFVPRREQEDDSDDEELRHAYVSYQDEEPDCGRGFGSGNLGSIGPRFQSLFPDNRGNNKASTSKRDPGWFFSTEPEPSKERGLLDKLTPSFLRKDDEEDFASACCPQLGFKQRLFGCAVCFLIGQLMQFCSFGAVAGVFLGHPGRFACMYTTGNITMVAASFFLSGPQAQCRKIKAKGRFKTSAVYFGTMAMTMVLAFSRPFLGRALLIMLCVAVQWCALVWYVLSFVPYGRRAARRVLGMCRSCLFR